MTSKEKEILRQLEQTLDSMTPEEKERQMKGIERHAGCGPTIHEYMEHVQDDICHYNVQVCLKIKDMVRIKDILYAHMPFASNDLDSMLREVFSPECRKFVDVNIKNDDIYLYSEFYNADKGYGRELSVMFQDMTPYLEDGSSLTIYDYRYDFKTSKPYRLKHACVLTVKDSQLKRIL